MESKLQKVDFAKLAILILKMAIFQIEENKKKEEVTYGILGST